MENDLKELRGLLKRAWTQDALARDRAGRHVLPNDKNAVSWCLLGGIYYIAKRERHRVTAMRAKFKPILRRESIPNFNNTHSHAEVLALIDRAIPA